MKTLSESDLEYVGGGDSWAGTAEGRAPYSTVGRHPGVRQ